MTRPPGSQGPREPEAFPLARVWASLHDWERQAIADFFGSYHDHEIDATKAKLDAMAEEWTEQLRKDAGFADKKKKSNVIPFTRGRKK